MAPKLHSSVVCTNQGQTLPAAGISSSADCSVLNGAPQPHLPPALLIRCVIVPCACSWLLKFYRAVLLIEAISAGDIGPAMSEAWSYTRQGPLLPHSHTLPWASLPPISPFGLCLPLPVSLPVSLPVFSCYPPIPSWEPKRTSSLPFLSLQAFRLSYCPSLKPGQAHRPEGWNTDCQ